MTTRLCAHCGHPFEPRPQVHDQAFCSAPECQRARKREWQRAKLQSDPDYRINQQAAQRAGAVLVLRALVLAFDDGAGRQVRDAHRRLGLVDVLATRTTRPEGVDLEVRLLVADHRGVAQAVCRAARAWRQLARSREWHRRPAVRPREQPAGTSRPANCWPARHATWAPRPERWCTRG